MAAKTKVSEIPQDQIGSKIEDVDEEGNQKLATISAPSQMKVAVDDMGTTQAEAADILRNLRDRAFGSSNEKLALALGRPVRQIEAWFNGSGEFDDDVVMKARAIAKARNVKIES